MDINDNKSKPGFLNQLLTIALILSALSFAAVVFFGLSSLHIKKEIGKNESFIKVAKEMMPNFEDSLSLYTGDTQKIIEFLLKIRPQTEEEFITFLSQIEKLGESLSLSLDIKTLESTPDKDLVSQPYIEYQIEFYGSIRDMKSFIRSLDDLPYYLRVAEINYTNPAFLEDEKELDKTRP